MASVKIILWKHDKKKNGTFQLALRITKNRKTRYIFTGQDLFEKDWDATACKVKKSHPNSTRLNNLLFKKLSEAQATLLEVETSDKNLSTQQIKKMVRRKGNNTPFFEVACERIKNKHLAGTFSVAKSERSMLYNIKEFIDCPTTGSRQTVIDGIKERRKQRISEGRKGNYDFLEDLKTLSKSSSITFEDMNLAFIKKFKVFCTVYLEQGTRTISNQLIFIRTLYNLAIAEGMVTNKNYPFAGEKEQIRLGSGLKIGLTREEVERIEQAEFEQNSQLWHTRNVWLFSFYFAGIRISDVLQMKFSDFKNNRLFYMMNKNEKPVSLKIPTKAKAILEYYKPRKKAKLDYIFPYLDKVNLENKEDVFTKSRNATSLLNKYLRRIAKHCKIDKTLSNHIARHTFGNLAGDTIHPLMLQKLYRHSDLKTTIQYQSNFITKEADDALDSVVNF
jgi:integrase